MTVILPADLAPLVNRLTGLLYALEPDVVRQQQVIELLTCWHCERAGSHALLVADGVHKHVKQLLRQP